MSDQDDYTLGSDPARMIEDGRTAMKQARRDLSEALVGAHLPNDLDDDALDEVLDELVERLAQRLAGDEESQPDADALVTKETRRAALRDLLTGRATTTDAAPSGRASFDGGAREPLPPPPPTHAETLGQVLRTRAADRGASL